MDKATLSQEITKATQAHESWKQKLHDAATTGTLPKPARDISCDDQCAFGQWLGRLKSDSALSVSLQFRKVEHTHAEFHVAAGRIAAMIEQGDKAGAKAALDGPGLNDVSGRLVAAMNDWQAAVS